ncbi:hypothetical protein AB0M35_15075 [Micromonospora sp. NPDC051196]
MSTDGFTATPAFVIDLHRSAPPDDRRQRMPFGYAEKGLIPVR